MSESGSGAVAAAMTMASAQRAEARGASRLGQFAWALYDGARSPYNVLVNVFIYSAYFVSTVIGDPVRGQVLWSYITSIAAVFIALGGPLLGAIADAGGRRKPWLAACTVAALPCMAALWYGVPHMTQGLPWLIAALVGAMLSFEYSAIFCNAMLPNVAPPGRLGFLSGLGLALANASGIILFVFFLAAWSWNPHPLFGLDPARHEPERAVGILAAAWFAVFALPLFFFTPDSPGTGRSIGAAVGHGLRSLAGTIGKLRRHGNVTLFLVARMSFNEGFIVLMLFTGVFASGLLHWDATSLTAEGLINSVVAALAGLLAGWLDDRLGSKASTLLFVAGCLVGCVILISITPHSVLFIDVDVPSVKPAGLFPTLPDQVFLIDQTFIALCVTGGLVNARSLMARLAPREMLNEFFGLYALSGTATSFVGPLAIGILTNAFNSQRAGISVGILFLFAGAALLTRVRVRREA